jgi:hypothetical protein
MTSEDTKVELGVHRTQDEENRTDQGGVVRTGCSRNSGEKGATKDISN